MISVEVTIPGYCNIAVVADKQINLGAEVGVYPYNPILCSDYPDYTGIQLLYFANATQIQIDGIDTAGNIYSSIEYASFVSLPAGYLYFYCI